MVDSRSKGARAETVIRDRLRELTGLQWERTPSSGALDPKHGLKGDLYVPGVQNLYCVEIKHYADDHLTSKVLTDNIPQLLKWWEQTVRESNQVNRKPLLIFKFNRSKIFVAFEEIPSDLPKYLTYSDEKYNFFISLLDDWYKYEQPKFI